MVEVEHCYLCGRVVEEVAHCKIINGLPKFMHDKCWKLYKAGATPDMINKLRRLNDGNMDPTRV